MKNKTVEIDDDNYDIIQAAKNILGVDEAEAVNFMIEIGLVNILTYPCGKEITDQKLKEIRKLLSTGKNLELVNRINSVWGY